MNNKDENIYEYQVKRGNWMSQMNKKKIRRSMNAK